MTPAELYELVKDLPREVWPDGLEYEIGKSECEHGHEQDFPMWLLDCSGIGAVVESDDADKWKQEPDDIEEADALCPAQYAAALFTAKLVEVLVLKIGTTEIGRSDVEWIVGQSDEYTGGFSYSGPTILHALIAAYKGASNG